MLNAPPPIADAALESLVLDVVAAVCRIDRCVLTASTSLIEVDLDSLTLSAVLVQVELACNLVLSGAVAAELLGARDFRELCSVIAREVRAARANEI
jgi:hypothetical protein